MPRAIGFMLRDEVFKLSDERALAKALI